MQQQQTTQILNFRSLVYAFLPNWLLFDDILGKDGCDGVSARLSVKFCYALQEHQALTHNSLAETSIHAEHAAGLAASSGLGGLQQAAANLNLGSPGVSAGLGGPGQPPRNPPQQLGRNVAPNLGRHPQLGLSNLASIAPGAPFRPKNEPSHLPIPQAWLWECLSGISYSLQTTEEAATCAMF